MNIHMKKVIQNIVAKELNKLGYSGIEFSVEEPPDGKMGDYASNAALKAAGKAKQSPKELAETLAKALKKPDMFESVKVLGPGFLNFTVAGKVLVETLQRVNQKKDKYGNSSVGKNIKVLVEYFQPNIAKPLHLGHLRTAIIGDAIFRILQFVGYKVESDTHIGDWGTQFGLLLYAYKQWRKDTVIEKSPFKELNELYVRINKEVEKNPELQEQGKAEFLKLEQGDKENRRLWKRFVEQSFLEFEKVYSLLGIRKHDHNWPESFYEDKMSEVIKSLQTRGLLKKSQGAKIVDLEPYKLGTAIIIKSDGGTTYLLRDLATFMFRKSKKFSQQLYVVDVRQEHAFNQTFKILELLGHIKSPSEAVHVSYGFLSTEEGIFSTRKGNSVGPVELIEQAESKVLEIIKEKNPDLKNQAEVARSVAVGAIKYFDLSHNRASNVVFRWDEVLDFEGNSGPYLQYAHARIRSILRKAGKTASADNLETLIKPEERRLLVRLTRFSETVELAATNYMPHFIAEYLYKLAGEFNQFYQNVRVLDESDRKVRTARLALVLAVAHVLKNGLNLLGIEAPEEM